MFKSGINIFKICLLINLLYADYFISFSFTSLNNIIIYYELNCARTLTNKNIERKLLFKIPTMYLQVKKLCKYQSQILIDNLIKFESIIYSNDEIFQNRYNFRTKLTFPPKRFDIIIKNGIAYFYLKGDN